MLANLTGQSATQEIQAKAKAAHIVGLGRSARNLQKHLRSACPNVAESSMTERKTNKPSKKAYDLDAPCEHCDEPSYIYVCETDKLLCADCYYAAEEREAA
jgi:hypothetical protein